MGAPGVDNTVCSRSAAMRAIGLKSPTAANPGFRRSLSCWITPDSMTTIIARRSGPWPMMVLLDVFTTTSGIRGRFRTEELEVDVGLSVRIGMVGTSQNLSTFTGSNRNLVAADIVTGSLAFSTDDYSRVGGSGGLGTGSVLNPGVSAAATYSDTEIYIVTCPRSAAYGGTMTAPIGGAGAAPGLAVVAGGGSTYGLGGVVSLAGRGLKILSGDRSSIPSSIGDLLGSAFSSMGEISGFGGMVIDQVSGAATSPFQPKGPC